MIAACSGSGSTACWLTLLCNRVRQPAQGQATLPAPPHRLALLAPPMQQQQQPQQQPQRQDQQHQWQQRQQQPNKP